MDVKRFVTGEIPLAQSFWIYFVLGRLAITLLEAALLFAGAHLLARLVDLVGMLYVGLPHIGLAERGKILWRQQDLAGSGTRLRLTLYRPRTE